RLATTWAIATPIPPAATPRWTSLDSARSPISIWEVCFKKIPQGGGDLPICHRTHATACVTAAGVHPWRRQEFCGNAQGLSRNQLRKSASASPSDEKGPRLKRTYCSRSGRNVQSIGRELAPSGAVSPESARDFPQLVHPSGTASLASASASTRKVL